MKIPMSLMVLLLVGLAGCGGGKNAAPASANAGAAAPGAGKPAPARIMTPEEQKALDLYNRWVEFRKELDNRTIDGDVKITASREQFQKDFVNMFGGVMPTTAEGMRIFDEQFKEAFAAGERAREEGAKIVIEARSYPPEVREVFWSLMTVHGIEDACVTADGSAVFFRLAPYASDANLLERETFPLDPADTNTQNDIYCWDLKTGGIDCVTRADPLHPHKLFDVSGNGSLVALKIDGRYEKKWLPHRLCIVDRTGGAVNEIVTGEPLKVVNLPSPIPSDGQYVSRPSISHSGERVLFVGGIYVNRMRDEGWVDENYHLLLWDSLSGGKIFALGKPTTAMLPPVISGDGATAVVAALPEAFDLPKDPGNAVPRLYLVPVPAGKPVIAVPLPPDSEWPSEAKWGNPPYSISASGRRVVFEMKSRKSPYHSQLYMFDAGTGQTVMLSATSAGMPAAGNSGLARISADGNSVVFVSTATDLPIPQRAGVKQIFLYDCAGRSLRMVTQRAGGEPLNAHSEFPSVSGDGSVVVFEVEGENLPVARSEALMSQVRVRPSRKPYLFFPQTGAFKCFGGRR